MGVFCRFKQLSAIEAIEKIVLRDLDLLFEGQNAKLLFYETVSVTPLPRRRNRCRRRLYHCARSIGSVS